MKTALSSRCSASYLTQADEIRVEWRDRKEIPDLPIKYPSLDILLQFTPSQIQNTLPDWEELKQYNTIAQGKFICACNTLEHCRTAKSHGLRFYLGYPATSFAELRALKELGAEYARINQTLFFDIATAAEVGIPLRVVPNVAFDDGLDHGNGIHGSWINPEHIDLYKPYVSAIEFENCKPSQEEAMFRIYSLGQGWKTDLQDLITGLTAKAYTPMLTKEMTKRRLNCRNKCEANGKCKLCDITFSLADYEKLENYKKILEERNNG